MTSASKTAIKDTENEVVVGVSIDRIKIDKGTVSRGKGMGRW